MSKIPYVFLPIPLELLTDDFLEDPVMMKFLKCIFSRISTVPRKVPLKHSKKHIELDPYEFIFGREKVAKEAGISTKQVEKRMGQLVGLHYVEKVGSKWGSTFSVYRLVTESFCKIQGQQVGQQVGHKQEDKKKEERKKIYKKTTTMPKSYDPKVSIEIVDGVVAVVGIYDCLKDLGLSFEDEKALSFYPEERVQKAVEYASFPTTKINKDLISTLIWHCKQPNPIPPKPLPMTDQQALAFKYNEVLRERGFQDLFEKNKKTIWENYVFRVYDGFEQSISLNNQVHEILKDLNDSLCSMGSNKIIKLTA